MTVKIDAEEVVISRKVNKFDILGLSEEEMGLIVRLLLVVDRSNVSGLVAERLCSQLFNDNLDHAEALCKAKDMYEFPAAIRVRKVSNNDSKS